MQSLKTNMKKGVFSLSLVKRNTRAWQ